MPLPSIAPARLPLDTVARARVLIAAVSTGRGSPCAGCGKPVQAHEVLMSIGTGYRNAARCLDCLARETGNPAERLLLHLAGWFRHRACYAQAWVHATQLEGREPAGLEQGELPHGYAHALAVGATLDPDDTWDAGDMGCGELVMELRLRLKDLDPGEILELRALDLGAREDIPAWCGMTGHPLLRAKHPVYFIQRKET